MKKIDKLLRKAAATAQAISIALFPPDDDGFLCSLGVEPKKFARKNRDGTIGYDIMAALNDVAVEVWQDM